MVKQPKSCPECGFTFEPPTPPSLLGRIRKTGSQLWNGLVRMVHWLHELLWTFFDWLHAGEFFLAASAVAALVSGVLLSGDRRQERVILGYVFLVVSVVLARGIMGRVSSWKSFRPAQWLVTPVAAPGYLGLLAVILSAPVIVTLAIGCAPILIELNEPWTFLEVEFVPFRTRRIPQYWMLVASICFAGSAVWWGVIALLGNVTPRPFCRLFHPLKRPHIQTGSTWLFVIAFFGLAPGAIAAWILSRMQQ